VKSARSGGPETARTPIGKRAAAKYDFSKITSPSMITAALMLPALIMVHSSGAKAAFNKLMKAVPLGSFLLLL